MKKGVILLISIVWVLAIVIVAFFGVAASNISPVVYITSVEILDMDGNPIETNSYNYKQVIIDFEPQLQDDDGTWYMQYIFSTSLQPDNATYDSILYSTNSSDETITCPNPRGGGFLIKESSRQYVISTITCRSNDGGPTVSDSVLVLIDYSDYLGID